MSVRKFKAGPGPVYVPKAGDRIKAAIPSDRSKALHLDGLTGVVVFSDATPDTLDSTFIGVAADPQQAVNGEFCLVADEAILIERPITDETLQGAELVVSETGGAKGRKLAAFDQIPTDALWELAEAYGRGVAKYPDSEDGIANWRRGYDFSLSYAAAFRHLTQAMGGEDIDPESGTKHVISAAWHLMALAHWMNDPEMVAKFDDRQAVLEKEGRK